MNSEFDKKLEELEDFIDEAITIPLFPNKYIIDGDKLRTILESVRSSLPQELKKAKEVLAAQQKTIERANSDAGVITDRAKKNAELTLTKAKTASDEILRQAKDQAESLVSNDAIVRSAELRAAQIMEQTTNKAQTMETASFEYIAKVIAASEESLTKSMAKLQQLKQSLYGDKNQ